MTKLDLHLHTTRYSPDSFMDPIDMLAQIRQVGLDGVVITEHDHLWSEDELQALRRQAPDLILLAGMEVSARGGDVLVYGITNPQALPRGIAWPELCDEVHRQGGVAIVAHPYRWGQDFDGLLARHQPQFDGVEMMSKNMDADQRRRIAALQAKHPEWACLGNSDSHELETLGCCYTEFDAVIRTTADLVAAIRQRKGKPKQRSRCPSW